jgi:hypothetical protein
VRKGRDMDIIFNSDKVGMALGLVVFLAIILVGLRGNVSAAVVIARALVGFTVAYVLGFMLSRWIKSAILTAFATERAKRSLGRKENQEPTEQESTETEPEL